MTQEQALAKFQAMFPEKAAELSVERERTIGYYRGSGNMFYLWDSSSGIWKIVASSERSWEHALAIAQSGNEDAWVEDDSAFSDEQETAA